MITDSKGSLKEFKKPQSLNAPEKIPMVIPQITAHWLRHTFITNMYLAGVDVMTAKEQAGHADITTTIPVLNSNTIPVAVPTDKNNHYNNE